MLKDIQFKGQPTTLETEGKPFEIVMSPGMLREAESAILLSYGIETHGGWDKAAEDRFRIYEEVFNTEALKANPELQTAPQKLEAVFLKAQEMAAMYKGGEYMQGFLALQFKTIAPPVPTEREPKPTDQVMSVSAPSGAFEAVMTEEMLSKAEKILNVLLINDFEGTGDGIWPHNAEKISKIESEFIQAATLANPGLDLTSMTRKASEQEATLCVEAQRMVANKTGGNYLRIFKQTYENG